MRRGFLENLDRKFFDVPQMSSIEIYSKNIDELIEREDWVPYVTRAKFIGCRLQNIPKGLAYYINIGILDFTDNLIENMSEDAFAKFEYLETLDLTVNSLKTFNCVLPITLRTLSVSFNPGIDLSGIWKQELPNLWTLKATHCGLTSLPNVAPPWAKTLITFHLDGNELSEVPEVLREFTALEELSLFGNNISTVIDLPQTLKTLQLGFNNLEDWTAEGVKTVSLMVQGNTFTNFPVNIWKLEGLRSLSISKSGITGELDFALPENVIGFDISNNEITGLSEKLIASMGKLAGFNMSYNKIQDIPDCFPEDLTLSRFFADHNLLTKIPGTLMQGKRIEVFSCMCNKIEALPEFNLPKLRSMNLAFNKLKEIPDCFRPSSTLVDLNISFNELTDLPASLSASRKISSLIAVRNQFVRIPRCILSFSQLRVLILSGNKLTSVPTTIGSFFFLKTLDLSNNHFREYPTLVNGLKSMRVLSFSHNMLTSISDEDLAPGLTLLDLSFNKIGKVNLNLPDTPSISLDYNELVDLRTEGISSCQFLSLNCNKFYFSLVEKLPEFLQMQRLTCLEYIGNDEKPIEIPPIRIHVLDSHRCSFPTRFGVGYAGTLGERQAMEDSVAFKNYDDNNFIAAVFDGHNGNVSSAIASHCICTEGESLCKLSDEDIPNGFSKAFEAVNEKLKTVGVNDGCTAVAAFFHNNTCYCAGVGDSRIVLVRSNSSQRMTCDSKPLNRDEFKRLKAAGIPVTVEGRINRKLAVARSLGDFWCSKDGLLVPPEITSFTIDDDTEAVILACDGLWDMMDDDTAADVVRKSETAVDAAVTLKNFGLALGSKDNISVIVIKLHASPQDCGLCPRNTVQEIPIFEEKDEEDIVVAPPLPELRRRRR